VFSLCCLRARNALLGDFVLCLVFHLNSSSKGYQLVREKFLVLNRCFLHGCLHHGLLSCAGSASESFEFGFWSLKSLFSCQQCLRIIRVWAPVPRISLFRPAAPPNYSSSGSGPSSLSFWASSASELFELGPWSLKSSIFGLATPSYYSIADFGPSNYLLWASSASTLFEGGCPILRITSFGHQHFVLFGCSSLSFEFLFGAFNALHSKYLNLGGNIPVQMPYVKYEGKSTVCNTRWPDIRIKRALPSNFPYLQYEVCTDGRIGRLSLNWASTR
jgi:hypothetical protein